MSWSSALEAVSFGEVLMLASDIRGERASGSGPKGESNAVATGATKEVVDDEIQSAQHTR